MSLDFPLPPSRPNLNRQRSNSVPTPQCINFSAEEASMLFTAAERATARRRRNISVDDNDMGSTLSRKRTSRSLDDLSSRPGKDRLPPVLSGPSTPSTEIHRRTGSDGSLYPDTPSTTRQSRIPIPGRSPTSPARLVSTTSMKAYADGLHAFTQSRLHNAIESAPHFAEHIIAPSPPISPSQFVFPEPPQLFPDVLEDDPHLGVMPKRPHLTSHFSNWSSTSAEDDEEDAIPSRRSSRPILSRGVSAVTGPSPLRGYTNTSSTIYETSENSSRKDSAIPWERKDSDHSTLSTNSEASSDAHRLRQFDFQFDLDQNARSGYQSPLRQDGQDYLGFLPRIANVSPFFQPGTGHAACSPVDFPSTLSRTPSWAGVF